MNPPGKYPFVVALVRRGYDSYNGQFCGGSLISADWVLTAAHCMVGEIPSTVDVVIGRHDLSTSAGERIRVAQIIRHPGYSAVSYSNDLALIRLTSPTSYTPVPLATDESLEAAGTTLRAAGWGTTRYEPPRWPYRLREVEVPVVGDAACLAAYAGYDVPLAALILCAGAAGKDSCQGDSGAPLFAVSSGSFTQVGIVSFGNGCGLSGFPGVYTSVAAFTEWIAVETGIGMPRPTPTCFGMEATIVGTPAGETIKGTAGDDVIAGMGGDDVINGLGGNDLICGGPGNDTITGGPGNDRVQGFAGNDVIRGGRGSDVLRGGNGDDDIRGGPGDDRLFGEGGNDTLHGDGGTDTVDGGAGTDSCQGETTQACEPETPGLVFESGNVHLAVPDRGQVASVITVNSPGSVTDLDVYMLIRHTWVGDLRVTLTHVDTGTTVTIIDRPGVPAIDSVGCSGDNINARLDDEAAAAAEDQCRSAAPTITGALRPNNLLSAFDGENLAGTWRLTVFDRAGEDTGFLEKWALHFTT